MKILCKTCQVPKIRGDFYKSRLSCKSCVIERNRTHAIANHERQLSYQRKYQSTTGRLKRTERFAWLDNLKRRPCSDCGSSFRPECMDFDHIDPRTKKFNVSYAAVAGYSVDLVKAEVAKCRLVCANCHRIRTAAQQNRSL